MRVPHGIAAAGPMATRGSITTAGQGFARRSLTSVERPRGQRSSGILRTGTDCPFWFTAKTQRTPRVAKVFI